MSTFLRRVYKLLHRPPDTPFERAKKAPMFFILDYTCAMGVYLTAIGALIAKLAAYYGFSVGVSTTIATLPSLLTALEFLSNRYFKHLRKFAVVWRLGLPMVLASVIFPIGVGRIIMLVSFVVLCLAFHIYLPSYNAWTVNVTQGHIRSNYFSTRDMFYLPTFTLLTFFFAQIVSDAEARGDIREGFLTLAGIELVFIVISLLVLFRALPSPNAPIVSKTGAVHPQAKEDAAKRSILSEFKQVLADKEYRMVLLFHLVWTFFFQFAGFSAVFQIQVLQQDYYTVTVYITISNVARMALLPVFSFIGVKYGWKKVLFACLTLMSLGTACWIFINDANLWLFMPAGILLTTIPWAGLGIAMFYFQIGATKMETRSIYFSAHAGLSGIVAALGVLTCNTLVAALAEMQNPPYWIVFALWLFGCIGTMLLVVRTPFQQQESTSDALEQEQDALEQELAQERAAATKQAIEESV